MKINTQNITIDDFKGICSNEHCGTLSQYYEPYDGLKHYQYQCEVKDFIKNDTYLVRFINKDGSRLVSYNDPEANPIRIIDFVKNKLFVDI